MEKLDKSYIFVYFLTHFLFIIDTVIRGAHDIRTCVIRKSQSLTFCLSISIRSHEARMIYARTFYGNF